MKQQGPMLHLWELGEGQRDGLRRAILSAVMGVLLGMPPYFAVAQIILGLLFGNQESLFYLTWCAAVLVGFLLRAALYSLALFQSHKTTFAILKSIREKVLGKLPGTSLGAILDTSNDQMKQVAADQVENAEQSLAHLLSEMTANMLGPVCILIYLFVPDWRTAPLNLMSIPVGMTLMMAVTADYGKQYEGSVKTTQAMSSAIMEYIGDIKVIKVLSQDRQSYVRFSDSVRINASYFYHWIKSCQIPVSLARIISPAAMITILPVGWLLHTGRSLPTEALITTIVLPLDITGPLLTTMDFAGSPTKVGTAVGSVDTILSGAEQDHEGTSAEFQRRGIQLSHVSFGYHADREVFYNVSLTIPAETMIALVGPSGSGEPTIAELTAGFWDVTFGAVTLGEQDLDQVPLKQLYDQVAFVSQGSYLFDESIRENIRMGRPATTDAEVEAVVRATGCDVFIHSLEHGYDTVVGGGGAHPSGGECQRITITRAVLKDMPTMVLDEAIVYIDPENETVVQQAVGKLMAGKTVLVIAHRLSTITDAGQIVVVNGDRSQDVGTHEELLKSCPLHQEMWRAHTGTKEGEQAWSAF